MTFHKRGQEVVNRGLSNDNPIQSQSMKLQSLIGSELGNVQTDKAKPLRRKQLKQRNENEKAIIPQMKDKRDEKIWSEC